MKNNYEVRFWNTCGENIKVGGKYAHSFDTLADAWDAANAMLTSAHKHGAITMDINDFFYQIIED